MQILFLFNLCSPTFWRIVKKRSIEEFSSIPYIILLLNASFWTYYGIIIPNGLLLITINGFGATVQAIYIFIFLLFAPPNLKVRTGALAGILNVGLLVGTILVTRLALERDAQIKTIGIFCVSITIISFASPLAAMRTVVKTRSVEYMPFFLSFFYFLVALMWAIYAVLVRDIFIGIPNGTGLALGVCQLVIYAVYRNAKPSKSVEDDSIQPSNSPDGALEEGLKHQQLPSSNRSSD
ncbi:hypothetical protein RD792_010483 [Penstemon davidsonii]|uniref:Bidirectional sugar transporter SWEET n=1 Tax=Penstemon davidsonii TaxID=160366 RepID=A0ABR0D3G2_9LAMI|nr:hypothetical protein RD792_010483 [Penstemon davidsonii]